MEQLQPRVNNLRDLASASSTCQLAPGRVFRCACPVAATTDDIDIVRHKMNVSTVIDLRSPEEIKEFGEPPIAAGSTLSVHTRTGHGWFKPIQMETQTRTLPGKGKHKPFAIHQLSILDRVRFVGALMPRLPIGTVAASLLYRIWDAQKSSDMFINEINKGGLTTLYEIILQTSTLEFGHSLKVITRTLEAGDSVMFYCKAGKDRTGLLAMLLLHVCGASDEEIVADYCRSDAHGQMALGDLADKREVQKLDRALFSRAPPEAMRHALTYLRQTYGTLEQYLEKCEFTAEEQRKLRELLVAKPT